MLALRAIVLLLCVLWNLAAPTLVTAAPASPTQRLIHADTLAPQQSMVCDSHGFDESELRAIEHHRGEILSSRTAPPSANVAHFGRSEAEPRPLNWRRQLIRSSLADDERPS